MSSFRPPLALPTISERWQASGLNNSPFSRGAAMPGAQEFEFWQRPNHVVHTMHKGFRVVYMDVNDHIWLYICCMSSTGHSMNVVSQQHQWLPCLSHLECSVCSPFPRYECTCHTKIGPNSLCTCTSIQHLLKKVLNIQHSFSAHNNTTTCLKT